MDNFFKCEIVSIADARFALVALILCFASLSLAAQTPTKIKNVTGDVFRYVDFPSKNVTPRNVDIWLPPDYAKNKNENYPVVYMLDGQNLFRVKDSFGNAEWGVDETMTKLLAARKIRPAIVVGVWSSVKRIIEYAPEKPFDVAVGRDANLPKYVSRRVGESDKFLKFLTAELKPFIDKTYRSKTEASETLIIGSSMGALLALYAVGEYPDVFGGAGCLSTQFQFADGVMLGYLEKYLPAPETHRIYFDYGTRGLDRQIGKYQKKADAIMAKKKYTTGENWTTRKFAGADHSEKSWRKRIDQPLLFLLGD